jgi:hypothetical protein
MPISNLMCNIFARRSQPASPEAFIRRTGGWRRLA